MIRCYRSLQGRITGFPLGDGVGAQQVTILDLDMVSFINELHEIDKSHLDLDSVIHKKAPP